MSDSAEHKSKFILQYSKPPVAVRWVGVEGVQSLFVCLPAVPTLILSGGSVGGGLLSPATNA